MSRMVMTSRTFVAVRVIMAGVIMHARILPGKGSGAPGL
jgi:hypothetical protein